MLKTTDVSSSAHQLASPRLACEQLSVHFGHRSALEGITALFQPGETVALLGPNGAGKSTLLRVLAGLLAPTHGQVRLDGTSITRSHPSVIYVPQRTSVDWTFPVSVDDVVLMALARRRSRLTGFGSVDHETALAALERVGMRQFSRVQIGQLSGGQQQRVFLARALLQNGSVYLLDEPFAGVDVPTQELLISLFHTLASDGRTIITATHDLAQAVRSSGRVLLLNRTLVADGPPRQTMSAENLLRTFGGQAIIPFDASESIVVGAG